MMQDKNAPSLASKEYWEDSKWLYKHFSHIANEYPNQWIAIADKKIIAYGENGGEVEKTAMQKIGNKEIVITFVEKGIYVY